MADDDGDEDDLRYETEKGLKPVTSELAEARRKRDGKQRAEAFSLLMAGLTYEQIADRLGVSYGNVQGVISRALAEAPKTGVDTLRQVENARLDRAQAAIWAKVLEGDQKAISTFLSISGRRSKLNGLDAPLQIEMSGHVKIEMQQALNELQEIVLGEVIYDAEEVDDGE